MTNTELLTRDATGDTPHAPARTATRQRARRANPPRGNTAENTTTTGASAPVEESVTIAGLVDIRDNHGFVRADGYLPGPDDVYVSSAQIKRYNLRSGDAVTGAARATGSGSTGSGGRRDKANPLVRLDTVNGVDPELARRRPEFGSMTPLYPQERLRLETGAQVLTTRMIDLVMPIGKGQRALIASPPKAGKTMVLQAIAGAIAHNHPECYLMVVLVDERPEEVTDMRRLVNGEVIASTFDRPAADHVALTELAVERAKRLVESGRDVVMLLDSITRLGRAYNNAAPANGRTLTGGIDSTALYAPKRFLGAARNLEDGGSLTIIATALVETGSAGDNVIFEEYKGTSNAELKLDRRIAERRVFPAIDIDGSGTRHDEILLAPEEHAIVTRLRKALQGMDTTQANSYVLEQLRATASNAEFLMQLRRATRG
jgi:transcription termination factor Rho